LLAVLQVRFLPPGSQAPGCPLVSKGVVRQVFHRPPDSTAPGSNCVVVSSYDAVTGALLMRAKQRCTFGRAPVKVCGVWCVVLGHRGDAAFQVLMSRAKGFAAGM